MENLDLSVFQFKIILKEIQPRIWRRILMPACCDFLQFRQAILAAMGWSGTHKNYHFHNFLVKNPETKAIDVVTTIDDPRWAENEAILEENAYVFQYFRKIQDFGDFHYGYIGKWEHRIILEMIVPADEEPYPRCLDGRRACPLEECLGPLGYKKLLNPVEGTSDTKIAKMLAGFHPEKFDVKAVVMFKQPSNLIFQFKIVLRQVHPVVWRRIVVPSQMNFRDFHHALQKAMGWQSSRQDIKLHEFRVNSNTGQMIRISIPTPRGVLAVLTEPGKAERELSDMKRNQNKSTFNEFLAQIDTFFKKVNDRAVYEYDFVAHWIHDIILEEITACEDGKSEMQPRCIAGERACPPDDCGGPVNYNKMLKIIRKPSHPHYKDKIGWLKITRPHFNPAEFNRELCFRTHHHYVHQIKMTLGGIHPKVWRRIQVPGNFTFRELHRALQRCMKWRSERWDITVHFFRVADPATGELVLVGLMNDINNSGIFGDCTVDVVDETNLPISQYLTEGSSAVYCYGLWVLMLQVEKIGVALIDEKYPKCLGGERAAPLETCGSSINYKDALEIGQDPDHERYKMIWEYLHEECPGYKFDYFNPEECFNIEQQTGVEMMVTLDEVRPKIWRAFRVSYQHTFHELHLLIQEVMGWKNVHEYKFHYVNGICGACVILNPSEGDWQEDGLLDSRDTRLCDLIRIRDGCQYHYGPWCLEIEILKIFPVFPKVRFPKCTAGNNACPPDSCGGPKKYMRMLHVFEDRKNPAHARELKRYRKIYPGFKPGYFSARSVFKR